MLDKIVQSALRRNDQLLGLDDVVEKEICTMTFFRYCRLKGFYNN